MNLIEQLGGYDSLKKEYEETLPLIQKGYKSKSMEIIRLLLLEHRRQHNIFEVGDKVVYKGEAGLNGLFEIERLTKTGKPKTVKTERFGNFPCRYCEVQHATPEEIQAGRRL